MAKTDTPNYAPIGERGIGLHVDAEAKVAYLRIPFGNDVVSGSPLSKTGKMRLVANTGGFQYVPGTGGLKLSLNAGFAADAPTQPAAQTATE
jgi:hypothetical protein